MNFTRSTTEPTILDIVNIVGRGGTDDWRALYQRAKGDAGLRAQIARALEMVDPDLADGAALWRYLLAVLDGHAA